jgi:hypothetical protein
MQSKFLLNSSRASEQCKFLLQDLFETIMTG